MGSGSSELRDCHGWVVSKFRCRHTIGAGPGRANDGVACCKFKHDPSKENSDPKEVIEHLARILCKHGDECPLKAKGCMHSHA